MILDKWLTFWAALYMYIYFLVRYANYGEWKGVLLRMGKGDGRAQEGGTYRTNVKLLPARLFSIIFRLKDKDMKLVWQQI